MTFLKPNPLAQFVQSRVRYHENANRDTAAGRVIANVVHSPFVDQPDLWLPEVDPKLNTPLIECLHGGARPTRSLAWAAVDLAVARAGQVQKTDRSAWLSRLAFAGAAYQHMAHEATLRAAAPQTKGSYMRLNSNPGRSSVWELCDTHVYNYLGQMDHLRVDELAETKGNHGVLVRNVVEGADALRTAFSLACRSYNQPQRLRLNEAYRTVQGNLAHKLEQVFVPVTNRAANEAAPN